MLDVAELTWPLSFSSSEHLSRICTTSAEPRAGGRTVETSSQVLLRSVSSTDASAAAKIVGETYTAGNNRARDIIVKQLATDPAAQAGVHAWVVYPCPCILLQRWSHKSRLRPVLEKLHTGASAPGAIMPSVALNSIRVDIDQHQQTVGLFGTDRAAIHHTVAAR